MTRYKVEGWQNITNQRNSMTVKKEAIRHMGINEPRYISKQIYKQMSVTSLLSCVNTYGSYTHLNLLVSLSQQHLISQKLWSSFSFLLYRANEINYQNSELYWTEWNFPRKMCHYFSIVCKKYKALYEINIFSWTNTTDHAS